MAVSKVDAWTTYSLVGVFFVMIVVFSGAVYVNNKNAEEDILAKKNEVTQVAAVAQEEKITEEESWETIYPATKTMTIGNMEVLASVAESWPDRIKGLSDTPYLPENVVKLFIFDSSGHHSIWMKDMNYSIDIIWVNEEKKIVHFEKDASPESYPEMFTPVKEAKYVIETTKGFIEKNGIKIGDNVVLPKL